MKLDSEHWCTFRNYLVGHPQVTKVRLKEQLQGHMAHKWLGLDSNTDFVLPGKASPLTWTASD